MSIVVEDVDEWMTGDGLQRYKYRNRILLFISFLSGEPPRYGDTATGCVKTSGRKLDGRLTCGGGFIDS